MKKIDPNTLLVIMLATEVLFLLAFIVTLAIVL